MSPEGRIRLHTWAAWIWLGLTIVTTVWAVIYPGHPLLLAWLVFMSGYAIVGTHWSAKEGAAPSAEAE
jgi:hypothetical protein